eukprot:Awhi_evm2s15415
MKETMNASFKHSDSEGNSESDTQSENENEYGSQSDMETEDEGKVSEEDVPPSIVIPANIFTSHSK